MLELDGSEGGGQLLRTALALSALTGRPFRMTGIRGGRPNPGIRPQHLAAVSLATRVTDGAVEDATEGSRTLEFEPGQLHPGRYDVDVGTAGSLPLLFDTVLPLSAELDGGLAIQARGGTDVRWAPTMDYYRRVKLPLLRRHGVAAAVDVDRRGFYPAGGGAATLTLAPTAVEPLSLGSAGPVRGARVYSVASADLADRDVAERQATAAASGLADLDVDVVERTVGAVEADSTGSAIALRLDRGDALAGTDALGERGTPAEEVGGDAAESLGRVIESGAVVDDHLADQLLVFLAIGGGQLLAPRRTDHVEANVELLAQFGYEVDVGPAGEAVRLTA